MEEMRKILGLPPTLPFKPKPIPQEKPKPSFPSLFKILPKFQSPLEILTRRSDDGSPRFAVISDIIQAASSFMRRALVEEEVNTLQDITKDNEKDKDDKDDKDDMMFLLDDEGDKGKDKNNEPDLEDLISLLPLAAQATSRPMPMPIPFPFRPIRRLPHRLPFGLPRPPMMSPRRQIIAVDPRRVSGPRMIPIEMAQSFIRPVPVPQQVPIFPMHQGPYGQPGPYGPQGPYGQPGPYGPQGPYGHVGPIFPLPSHPGPQIVPIFQIPQQAMPRMSRMMHPQQIPMQQFQMHPEPMMHRPQYPHPMQPVMVMLHPTIVPHFVPRPVYVQEPHPVHIPIPVPVQEMEPHEQQEGNETPVMALIEDQRGGRSLPFFPRPSLSPLQKVQIIRELLMARQSSFPIFPFGRPNRSPVPHFHPPVPQQKRPEPREEKSSGSFLRPIFLPL